MLHLPRTFTNEGESIQHLNAQARVDEVSKALVLKSSNSCLNFARQ